MQTKVRIKTNLIIFRPYYNSMLSLMKGGYQYPFGVMINRMSLHFCLSMAF